MSILDYFRRYSRQKQRRNEMELCRKIAELTRKASTIKRQADRLKAEAVQFEKAGDHKRAVSAAASAAQQEKSYQSALNALQNCKNMHVQVKSQKEMKELITSCTLIIKKVCDDADTVDYIKAQNDFAQTMEEMEQSRDALEAAQEGFALGTQEQVRNEAGEQALAQIMEQLTPREAPPRMEPSAAFTVSEQDPTSAQHKEWADDRRKILAEMV